MEACGFADVRGMQMERLIKLAASLPDGSGGQTKLTANLIKELWDSLQHPPLSYLGDDHVYRTADGSNNVRWIETVRQTANWLMKFCCQNFMYPKLGMAGSVYARSVKPLTQGRPYPDPSEVFDSTCLRI